MATFQARILAADRDFYNGPCESITLPTVDGEDQILSHHSNMTVAIVPGTLRLKVPGQAEQTLAVSAGLVKMENNEALVLVDSLERPEEIDANRARRAADAAREALLQKRSLQEYRMAQSNLSRALNRLRVKSSYRK